MGLIKAAVGATGGVLADQWKEFFYCDSMDKSVMVVKGQIPKEAIILFPMVQVLRWLMDNV